MEYKLGHQPDRPPYRDALEAIGRYFDAQLCRGIFVAEVAEGYIGKAYPGDERVELHASGFTFPYDDVCALIDSPVAAAPGAAEWPPYCPYGYSLFLQAVGEMCDRTGAYHISVLEVINGFAVCYSQTTADGRSRERRRHMLDRIGVEELISRVSQ